MLAKYLLLIRHTLPNIDEEDHKEMIAKDYRNIQQALSSKYPLNKVTQPFGFGGANLDVQSLNFEILVNMQHRHQTKQAAKGVWTRGEMQQEDNTEVSVWRQIICRFHEVVKAEQQKGPCTGVNWSIYWWAPAPGARDGLIDGASAPNLENSNSANAAISATAATKWVSLLVILSSKPWELTILGCHSTQQYIPQSWSAEHSHSL